MVVITAPDRGAGPGRALTWSRLAVGPRLRPPPIGACGTKRALQIPWSLASYRSALAGVDADDRMVGLSLGCFTRSVAARRRYALRKRPICGRCGTKRAAPFADDPSSA